PRSDTLVLNAQVSNTGAQPMKLVGFTTSNLTFGQGDGLSVEPAVVPPQQTVPLKVTIRNKVWSEQRLIPLDKPQMGVAGLLAFESDGKQNWVTTEAPVTRTAFRWAPPLPTRPRRPPEPLNGSGGAVRPSSPPHLRSRATPPLRER